MTEMDIRVWLYGITGTLAVIFTILVCYGIGGSLIQNFLTTSVGSVFTILIVANILRLAEKKRTLPVRFAAYDDARGLYDSCRFTWVEMLVAALNTAPNQDADLFSNQYCLEACEHLDLDKQPYVLPRLSWRDHLYISSNGILKRASDYLVRYINTSADMGLIGVIRKLERSPFLFLLSNLAALLQADRAIGVIRPPVLSSGVEVLAREFLSTLQELRNHLEQIAQEFRNQPGFFPVSPAAFTEDLLQFTPPKLGAARFDQRSP